MFPFIQWLINSVCRNAMKEMLFGNGNRLNFKFECSGEGRNAAKSNQECSYNAVIHPPEF